MNNAIAGRSARSFTDEGRFTTLINTVNSGDYVVIEFGHNDGSAGAVDNGRQEAVGDGYNTTSTVTTSSYANIPRSCAVSLTMVSVARRLSFTRTITMSKMLSPRFKRRAQSQLYLHRPRITSGPMGSSTALLGLLATRRRPHPASA